MKTHKMAPSSPSLIELEDEMNCQDYNVEDSSSNEESVYRE